MKKFLGSGFFSGYLPYAPGTYGSLVALGIYFIPQFQNYYVMVPAIIISILIGIPIGNYFETLYGKDPNHFVLDEFAGTWIALLTLPDNFLIIAFTFFIWRILDIIKPFPANKLEKISGGLGIMLDDIVSGMYSLIIIYIFNVLIN